MGSIPLVSQKEDCGEYPPSPQKRDWREYPPSLAILSLSYLYAAESVVVVSVLVVSVASVESPSSVSLTSSNVDWEARSA